MRSQDTSLVDFIALPSTDDKQAEYEVHVVGKNPNSFKSKWVEFTSKITGQRELLYVSYSAPAGAGLPLILPCGDPSSPQCRHFLATPPPDRSFKGLCLALLGQTSAWIIGFSIFLGLIILLLILCCSPRSRGAGDPSSFSPGSLAGWGTPGSPSFSPYGGTPGYRGASDRSSYQTSPASAHSSGVFTGDVLGRSRPEEHDEARRVRQTSTYYRRTMTANRAYLSESESPSSGGGMSLGQVSTKDSPGLFSVTQ